jgi:four helix bundle protein
MVEYDLGDRLLSFSSMVVDFTESLPRSPAATHIRKQMLRSGTAPMANYEEAERSSSRDDFVYRMRVSLKELRETLQWIRLAARKGYVEGNVVGQIRDENEQLVRIFSKSVKTAAGKS